MLQQILNDMYIDPELLQELDEEQKQMLFCKMREEQLRKWFLMEKHLDEMDEKDPKPKKEGGKRVSFLLGDGGEPSVYVIDSESPEVEAEVVLRKRNSLDSSERSVLVLEPVDESVTDEGMEGEEEEEEEEEEELGQEEEAQLQEKARQQTEMETEDLRKAADEELDKLVRMSRSAVQSIEETSIKAQNAKNNDPTREAVVKSLQEATLEMEREMRALEVEEQKSLQSQNSPEILEPIANDTPNERFNTEDTPTNTPLTITARPKITVTPYRTTTLLPIKKLNASFLGKEVPVVPVPAQTKTEVKKANNSISFANSFQNANGPGTPSIPSSNGTIVPNGERKIPSVVSCTRKTPPSSPINRTVRNGPRESISHSIILNNERRQAFANYVFDSYHYNEAQRELELSKGVSAQIEQFEKLGDSSLEALKSATLERAKKRRQKEILDHLHKQVALARKNSKLDREDKAWREQERKAKEAERNIREIARRARAEHRRTSLDSVSPLSSPTFTPVQSPLSRTGFRLPLSVEDINGNVNVNVRTEDASNVNTPTSPLPPASPRPTKPPSKQAVIDWFREEELPKETGVDRTSGKVATWFHGIISRQNAERMLSISEVGSYLVRVSERIWGYAVSYKAPERCRHYLVDVVQDKYAFLGAHQAVHDSLGDLVKFHMSEPITATGCELLQSACPQQDPTNPDYLELFAGSKHL